MSDSKKDATLALLFEQPGVTLADIKFFKGSKSDASEEDFWSEVHSAFRQERDGTATISTSFADDVRIIDAKAFLDSL